MYDLQRVISITQSAYGDAMLSSFSQQVVMTAFSVGAAGVPWAPILFGNVPKTDTLDARIVDAVVSSSAMPGMFASYPWTGRYLVDGAFYNHDPSLAAIATAVKSGVALEDIVLIDVGTGFMAEWIEANTTTWGATEWETNQHQNTPPLFLGSDRKSPVTNMSLNGTSTILTAKLAGMLLGERCLSLNPPIKYVPENAISELDYLWRAGTEYVGVKAARLWLDQHWIPAG
jgi:predicted acylesterase/phospholipase RssA